MVSWIVFLVIGGLIGWIASLIMKTGGQMGCVANVLVGIFGSALGAWVAPRLGIVAGGIGAYLVAVGGAVVLIFLLKLIGVFK